MTRGWTYDGRTQLLPRAMYINSRLKSDLLGSV